MTYAVNPTIFRAYDIRGVVDVDLSEAAYHTLGRAAGTYFRQRNADKPQQSAFYEFHANLLSMLKTA